MWLVLLLSGMSLFVGLFPYGDSLANRLALPLPVILIGSSLYLLVGRWRGFIDYEQLSLFGRAWIIFATLLAIVSAQLIATAGSSTSIDAVMRVAYPWIAIVLTILPAYLVAQYLFDEEAKR
jgi:hypothetical protein